MLSSAILYNQCASFRRRSMSTRVYSNSSKFGALSFYYKRKPKFTSGFRFQVENNKNIILYPEGKVELNYSAGRIFELCTGNKTVNDIKKIIAEEYHVDNATQINNDVDKMLKDAVSKNWIKLI